MDRITIEPLLVKEEVIRDGEALAQQAGDELFGVTLFFIALVSLSFGLWMLVVSRRMKREDSEDSLDQTVEVEQQQSQGKQVPVIQQQQIQSIPLHQPITTNFTPMTTPSPSPLVPLSAPETANVNIAPLPPTGLPDGWTMEQWEHYGWKYIEAFSK